MLVHLGKFLNFCKIVFYSVCVNVCGCGRGSSVVHVEVRRVLPGLLPSTVGSGIGSQACGTNSFTY